MRIMNRPVYICLVCLLFLLTGCDSCEKKEVASLLLPADNDDGLMSSGINYRLYEGDITCLDSRFSEIAVTAPPPDVRTDLKVVSGSDIQSDFTSAALLIRSEIGFNALKTKGCLDTLPADFSVDWTRQTLVVFHVSSIEACMATYAFNMLQTSEGVAQLKTEVFLKPNDNCEMSFNRAVVIGQANARARISVVSDCADVDRSGDV